MLFRSHVGEGLFLALWNEVGGTQNLEELTSKTPEELLNILDKIYETRASRLAVVDLGDSPEDQALRQTIMFATDILPYFELRNAIRVGDVGRMEDLLPTLLFRFAGGGNHKYAVEIMELIHKLRVEWPEELR